MNVSAVNQHIPHNLNGTLLHTVSITGEQDKRSLIQSVITTPPTHINTNITINIYNISPSKLEWPIFKERPANIEYFFDTVESINQITWTKILGIVTKYPSHNFIFSTLNIDNHKISLTNKMREIFNVNVHNVSNFLR